MKFINDLLIELEEIQNLHLWQVSECDEESDDEDERLLAEQIEVVHTLRLIKKRSKPPKSIRDCGLTQRELERRRR